MILGNPEPIEVKTIESMMSNGLISMGIDSTAFQLQRRCLIKLSALSLSQIVCHGRIILKLKSIPSTIRKRSES